MAFVSLLAVYFVIIIVIFAILAFIGTVLLVIGLVKRKKAAQQGKKYPYVFIVLGILFLAPPVLTVGGILVTAVATTVRGKIADTIGYENCVDRWKDRWVSESVAEEAMLEEFIEAAESRDKDALMALYTDEIQNDAELSGQVDDFLAGYPGGFSADDFETDGASSESGEGKTYFNVDYEGVKDGEYYYISFSACCVNDEHEEQIGLRYFYFKSEKAVVLENKKEYEDRTDSQYILAMFDVEGAFETRRVWGNPFEYMPVDRQLTKEQMIDALKKVHTIEELEEIIGEPNGSDERMSEVLYELVPEGGEPQYAVVTHDDNGGIILNSTYFAGADASDSVWLDKNGNPKKE